MRIETITHPSGDQLPILLNDDGFPIPDANEFIVGRRALSANTLVRNLRELSILYRWLEEHNICIGLKIKSQSKYFTEAEIRGSLFEACRKSYSDKSLAVSANTYNQRITTLRQFFNWLFDIHISSIASCDRSYDLAQEHRSRVMRWFDSSYLNTPPAITNKKKSITTEEAKFLLEILHPDNPEAMGCSPLVRYRNYVSVLIMLNFGLRPGELLSLKVEDVVIGAISSLNVTRRPPDPKDIRKPRPKIKRNGRIMSINEPSLARLFDNYILYCREELEDASDVETDYLIISREGKPLSQSRINQLFTELRTKYPNNLPSHLTPKALRHTFSSEMERTFRRAGLEEERRREALAELRGDSNLSSQDPYLNQFIEEEATKALKEYQSNLLGRA